MKTEQFVEFLEGQGVDFCRDGSNLKYRAPKGVINKDLLAQLQEKKSDIILLLQEREREEESPATLTPDWPNINAPFSLTDAQQAYWDDYSEARDTGNAGWYSYIELESRNLDIGRLNEAWQKVVNRHEMLRAVIMPDGSQQILEEVPPYTFQVYDLRGKPSDEAEEALEAVRSKMLDNPINFEAWPAFDIQVSLHNDLARLHIKMGYLFVDASSHILIFDEWYSLYDDPGRELPPLEISFRDYVLRQMGRKKTRQYRTAREYWLKRLQAFSQAPPLPLAREPAQAGKLKSLRRSGKLDAERWSQIKKRAAELKVTTSSVLPTAFAQVLSSWAKTPEFTINLTFFNRENLHPQVSKLVGDYTSLVPMEVDNSRDESFIQKARLLQQQLMEDIGHIPVSGGHMLQGLARKRGSPGNTAVPIVLTSTSGYGTGGPGGQEVFKFGEPVYGITRTPQVWLNHQVLEFAGELLYNWDSTDELFPAGLMDSIFKAYQEFLYKLAESESAWHEVRQGFKAESSLDLQAEAVLDPAITAEGLPLIEVEEPHRILLTGATGFLGAFLLHELLHSTQAKIYCLVRAPNNTEAGNRLRKNLEHYGLWDQAAAHMIVPVTGDLSKPLLGITERDYDYLANAIEVIYHNGGMTNFMYSYPKIRQVNVTGTEEILRFACRARVKPVNYVSTVSVFSDHGLEGIRIAKEDDDIDSPGFLDTPYAQSKWIAEKLIWTAKARGVPVTVYRPGYVTGDTRKGIGKTDDFIYRVFKGSLQVGCVPKLEVELDALPVDFVSRAIINLSREKDSRGRVFHLVHPNPVHLDYLVNWIKAKGHMLEVVPWETWRACLAQGTRENALYPVLPMFPTELEEENGKLIFSMDETLKKLNDISVEIPPIDDELLNTYYSYLTGIDYIPKGEAKGESA